MVKTAKRIKNLSITEQGAGVFDFEAFFDLVVKNQGQWQRASIHPSRVDLRNNSTYFLPFSRQSVYASMMPISFNVTLLNPSSLHAQLLSAYTDI